MPNMTYGALLMFFSTGLSAKRLYVVTATRSCNSLERIIAFSLVIHKNLIHDLCHSGNGYCVSHSFNFRRTQLRSIDANDLTVHVQKSASAVSGIDSSIGLDEGFGGPDGILDHAIVLHGSSQV